MRMDANGTSVQLHSVVLDSFRVLKTNGRKRLDSARHAGSRNDEEEGKPPEGIQGHEDGDPGGQEDLEEQEGDGRGGAQDPPSPSPQEPQLDVLNNR